MPLWKVALFTFIHLVLFTKGKVKSCQAPEIRFKPNDKENIYANETSDIKLPCNIKTNGEQFPYHWQKDNKTFRPSDHRRMSVKMYRWLKIKKVRKDDAGLYTCVVMNKCGEKSSVSMHLYVRELPTRDPNKNLTPAAPRFTVLKLKLQQKLIALPVGNSAKLDCSADGYPRPWVAWYKNGKPFTKRRGSFLYLDWKYVLALKDVVPSDTGTYSCNVSNYLGWINHSYYVDVHERSRAKPVVLPMPNATVFVGEKVTLICRAYSDAMPHFQWLRWFPFHSNSSGNDTDSKKFSYEVIKQNQQDSVKYQSSGNNKDEFHGVPLSLVNVTKKDEGKYTCIVGNAHGYSVKHAYIVVQEKLETTASPPETNATFWQDTNGNLRPSAESRGPLLSSSSSKRKIRIAVFVAASVFFIVLFGIGFYLYQRKMELAKEAKYGLVNSHKPNEIAVEYRAHDPSVGGYLSSCESTAPMMRQPSLRSRLASNRTQMSEEDMPLDEKWEIDRKLISLQEAKYGLVNSPKPNEIAVEYRARDPSVGGSPSSCESTAPLMRQPGLRSRLASNLTQVSEEGMPLHEKWEIDRELISLQEVLGEGAFGRVMKAEVFGMPNMPFRLNVAVKMLKENATEQGHTDLISELELMKTIGKHKNIINLIAACTQGGPLYVVVEYALNGNLRQFLRTRRPTREYPTLLTAVRERGPVRENGSTLTNVDLVSFSYQVCRGMEYLSSKKCIHRDLAARNVLVAEDNTMKIADFGLSRQVHPKGYYRKTKEGLLPVMWMAVESLFDCVYNTQSDVWSFGILLWEMVTFGGTPYPGVSLEKLFELLKSGYRMEKPLNCPENMYQIMLKCWQYSPTQRPTFEELVKEFDAMLVSLSDKVDSARQLEEEEIHQEASLMIPLATRASNSALVSPSTPRNTGRTEHEMKKDGRDSDSVSPHHDTNVIWEVRNPSTNRRQLLKRGRELQSPEIAADKKKFSDTTFPRVPIQSNV